MELDFDNKLFDRDELNDEFIHHDKENSQPQDKYEKSLIFEKHKFALSHIYSSKTKNDVRVTYRRR